MAKTVSSKSKSGAKSRSSGSKSKPAVKKTSPVRSSRLSRATQSTRNRRSASSKSSGLARISNERKLDILGVVLGLIGFLTLLSLISSENGTLTGLWISALTKVAGWGTFVLPLALILLGVWLVMRNVESLPVLSFERVFGFVLLYLNILAWLHFFAGGTWDQMKKLAF
mgnify:CR=1 FL=1